MGLFDFALNSGQKFSKDELRILDQRNFSGLSFGVGLKINKMKFSYTHARYTASANSSFFGLQIDLN